MTMNGSDRRTHCPGCGVEVGAECKPGCRERERSAVTRWSYYRQEYDQIQRHVPGRIKLDGLGVCLQHLYATSPVIRNALELYLRGEISLERALTEAVVGLAAQVGVLMDREVRRLQEEPPVNWSKVAYEMTRGQIVALPFDATLEQVAAAPVKPLPPPEMLVKMEPREWATEPATQPQSWRDRPSLL